MIDFLRGKAVLATADYVILDVKDIGYRVFCANPYALAGKADQVVTLYIHYHVREDAVQLFGFPTREEQSLFRKLLDVTGIGPRVALGILSGGTPGQISAAVQNEDLAFLTRLPGIGKKTAQRIVLDLKDKLAEFTEASAWLEDSMNRGEGKQTISSSGAQPSWREAKEALLALGLTEAEAERALREVKGKAKDSDGAETLIKLALQSMYQA